MTNRKQFSRKLAEKYGYTYHDAEQMCKDVFELLATLIYEEGEDVVIPKLGSFKHKMAKAKNVRHPGTHELVRTPERIYVKFAPSESVDI